MAAVASTQAARCTVESPSKAPLGSRTAPRGTVSVCSRRAFGISAGVAFGLRLQQVANAKDVPLFGIRKRDVEKVEKVIEEKVEQIVKEGEQVVKEGKEEANAVLAAAKTAATQSASDIPSTLAPGVQAGVVVAAELIGVAVASSIVSRLVATSK